MASTQEILFKRTEEIKRTLFDNNITRFGTSSGLLRIKSDEDDFGNTLSETTISDKTIEVIIKYPPGGVPIDRIRSDSSAVGNDIGDGALFFFDVLPIDLFTKWGDKVYRGDILVDVLFDENGKGIPLLLKVTEEIVSGQVGITWRKQLCAPYNGVISASAKLLIDAFIESKTEELAEI